MLVSALVSALLLSAAAPGSCAGTYDSTEDCAGPTHVALEGATEDIAGESEYDETPQEVDSNLIGWELAAVAGVTALGAGAMHLGQLFYVLHQTRLAEAGALTPRTAAEVSRMQTALGYGAIGMWLTTALIGGSGAAFFVFEPKNGALKLSILGD